MGVVFVNNLDVEVVVIIRFIVIVNDILIIKNDLNVISMLKMFWFKMMKGIGNCLCNKINKYLLLL